MTQDTRVAHHFETIAQQRQAERLGVWIFLGTEVLFFGGLFAAYTVYRVQNPAGFAEASGHLSLALATINTAVLLTSSWTMVLAVHALTDEHRRRLVALLGATSLLGLVFLGIKAVEYSEEIRHGLFPGASFAFDAPHAAAVELFFVIYFTMTGLHAVHLALGVLAVAGLAFAAWRGRDLGRLRGPVDAVGLYWHFVDIVWLFLYPLLYLIEGT